jgi:FtsH-binding integral membrane protein
MLKLRILSASVSRATVMAAALLAPVVAWAQDNAPPSPTLSRTPKPWMGFVVMFLLLALVLGVSLMPSKRGHQD